MPSLARFCRPTGLMGLVLVLGACSTEGGGLSTGSLFGGGKKPEAAAAPVVVTPKDRALHVGATSARASRCGYVFDPAAVRASYLAFEAQQGTPVEVLGSTQQAYDYTVQSVAKKIQDDRNYCDDSQTVKIKSDLNKVLAGDFSPPTKKADVGLGWFDSQPEKFDREKLFELDTR